MKKYRTSVWKKNNDGKLEEMTGESFSEFGRTAFDACQKRANRLSLIPDFYGLMVVSTDAAERAECVVGSPGAPRPGKDQVRGRTGIPIAQNVEIDHTE